MQGFDKNAHKETVERYCHIIGANATISRFTENGKTVVECMNLHNCEKNGGCRNSKYAEIEQK